MTRQLFSADARGDRLGDHRRAFAAEACGSDDGDAPRTGDETNFLPAMRSVTMPP
jgi:hypothetical protein